MSDTTTQTMKKNYRETINRMVHMRNITLALLWTLSWTLCVFGANSSATLPFTGRLSGSNGPVTGNVHLKLSLYHGTTLQSVWTNDGTQLNATVSEPTAATITTASNGIFTVWLGDETQTNMVTLPTSAFQSEHLFLRVWVSDTGTSFTALSPDKKMGAQAFAFRAHSAGNAEQLGGVTPSAFGLSLLTSTQASTAQSVLGLGNLASQHSSSIAISGGNVSGVKVQATSLEVSGAANLSGLIFPSTLGSTGNVLKLGSAGNLYWAADDTGATVISANAITATELATGAVTADQIATGAVTTAEILDGTVQSADLATNLAVSGNLSILGQGNISGVLYPNSVGTAGNVLKLGSAGNLYWAADDTGAAVISANAITATELATDAVTADQIATGAVTTTEILDGTIATVDIADNSVTTAKILDGTIATVDLATSSVTTAQILDGTIATADLADGSVTMAKLGSFVLSSANMASNIVSSDNIVDGSITASDLGAGSVTSAKLDSSIAISGTFRVSGSSNLTGLLYPTTDGSANTFLMTNGSGNLSFASANQILGSSTISSLTLASSTLTTPTLVGGTLTNSTLVNSTLTSANVVGANLNNVTIGTTTPSTGVFTSANVIGSTYLESLTVQSSGNTALATSGNRVGIGTAPTSYRLTLPNESGTGGMAIAYTWATYSSKKYKRNVQEIDGALAKVKRMRGVSYDSKAEHGGAHQLGFIAEEVGEVIPEVVLRGDDGEVTGMDYSRIPALNLQAIKELELENAALKSETIELRLRLERMERALNVFLAKP